jgi:RNA polymerase sigma factor (sigma-70 family)
VDAFIHRPREPAAPVEPRPAAADERELVAAVLRKDRKAAARFVAGHIDAVYGYVRHRLSPRMDMVDDAVQDVFMAALDGLAGFQADSSLRSWLLGIARHKVEDVYRKRLRAPEDLEAIAREDEQRLTESPALEERIDAARARERTRQVIGRLPERYALMLRWRYWEQRSVREIAAALGATEKSVERTLARARQQFKALWVEEEVP